MLLLLVGFDTHGIDLVLTTDLLVVAQPLEGGGGATLEDRAGRVHKRVLGDLEGGEAGQVAELPREAGADVLAHVDALQLLEVLDGLGPVLELVALDVEHLQVGEIADVLGEDLELVAGEGDALELGETADVVADVAELAVGDLELAEAVEEGDLDGEVRELVEGEEETLERRDGAELGGQTLVGDLVLAEVEVAEELELGDEVGDHLDTAVVEVETGEVGEHGDVLGDAADAEVVAELNDGTPLITCRKYGKGKLIYVNAALENEALTPDNNYYCIYRKLAELAGVSTPGKSPAVGITRHILEDGKEVKFFINYSDKEADGLPGNGVRFEINS